MTRSFSPLALGSSLLFACLLSSTVGPQLAEARSPRKLQRFLIQILVQTPRRFSVPNVKVYADGQLLGDTDKYGIFIGFFSGRKGQKVKIAIRKKAIKLRRDRKVRLKTKITGTAILPVPVKLYFRIKENGAAVFRVDPENRQKRIELDQIATVNTRNGEIKAHGKAEVSDAEMGAIKAWLEARQALLTAREVLKKEGLLCGSSSGTLMASGSSPGNGT